MSKPSDSESPRDGAAVPPPQTGQKPEPTRPAQGNESGGPAWPEPTRYGDWERGGRVSDF